eukprot:1620084-Rhodomonas_salina.2
MSVVPLKSTLQPSAPGFWDDHMPATVLLVQSGWRACLTSHKYYKEYLYRLVLEHAIFVPAMA